MLLNSACFSQDFLSVIVLHKIIKSASISASCFSTSDPFFLYLNSISSEFLKCFKVYLLNIICNNNFPCISFSWLTLRPSPAIGTKNLFKSSSKFVAIILSSLCTLFTISFASLIWRCTPAWLFFTKSTQNCFSSGETCFSSNWFFNLFFSSEEASFTYLLYNIQ